MEIAMPRVPLLALALLSMLASTAFAEDALPLPDKMKGAGTVSGTRRGFVNPMDLSQIKQDGDKVTGVISDYRYVNGQCEANNTPFAGTYAGGVLAGKSARLETKKADGASCGMVYIEATYSNGSLVGTYRIGQEGNRINIEFPLK
jgi:hypothetical protein